MRERIEKGKIYELDNGWGSHRVIGLKQEYDSFNPDISGEFKVRVVSLNGSPKPFYFKRKKFEDLIIEEHGYYPPE